MNKEERLKHLEMIQSIINRLAGNSFLIKGWTITISLTGFGLFVNNHKPVLLSLVAYTAFLFWILDAYYLRQERLSRKLYEHVVNIQNSKKTVALKVLSMDISKYQNEVSSRLCVMLSFPTIIIYALIFIMSLVLYHFF